MKKFYIIDGHALCYRAYYAFIKNPLINSKGQNTSAVYGFAKMLLKLVAEQKPDYLAVAFDPKEKSFRFKLYDEYKANRKKMPDDLRQQIEEIKNLVGRLGIPSLISEGFEADDVLGSVAKKFGKDSTAVVLVTGDKDAYQLVNPNVSIYANTKGISEYDIYDREKVFSKLSIYPEQVIDYMALTGDTADNVPGIKGIGEKTALKLISDYGSLDGIFANSEKLKGKLKDQIENGKDSAYLSKELVTINCDVEINHSLDDFSFKGIDNAKALEYFRELEMNSLINEFSAQQEEKTFEAENKNYITVTTRAKLDEMLSSIREKGLVSIDTETTSVKPMEASIVGVSFSVEEKQGWYIPADQADLFSEKRCEFSFDEALSLIKAILEDDSIKKIGQNIKYDILVYRNAGIDVRGVIFDTMIASYVLENDRRRHNLDDMALDYLNYKTITYDDITGTGKNRLDIRDVPLDKISEYAAEDTDIALRLFNYLKPRIEAEESLKKLFYDIEMPLVGVLADMEYCGVKIDKAHFAYLSNHLSSLMNECEEKIYSLAGGKLNLNSTKELASLLFEKLGLKTSKKTKTGYSTDISVLESLKGSHEIIDYIIDYRIYNKLNGTYIAPIPLLVNERTGRVHTSYNQTIVSTGRLSSTEPNLQNIPAKSDFVKKVRRGFVPEKGYILLSADYSQIELRLAAHITGDANMKKAFTEKIDIHNMTASSVFGVSADEVTPQMRRQAKIINFATIYGVTPFGLSQQADISMSDAKVFIEKYYETYPKFRDYIDRIVAFASEKGYVETICGRRRYIPDIASSVSFRREGAERIAINTPIQGSSADMIKIAMRDIHSDFIIKKMRSRIILQVHDELVVETHESEKDEVSSIVRIRMENAIKLDVPVVVDIKIADNWAEAH